jgi:hypothetical protein
MVKLSAQVLLLPGEHTISARQNGYQDSTQTVIVQPGQAQIVHVSMEKAATGAMPPDAELATIKVHVNPSRAAVFLDGRFVGHVGELGGLGRALQVVPGTHQIRIALPGYKTFQTDINPRPRQKVEVKTDLVKSAIPVTEPLLKGETESTPSASEARDQRTLLTEGGKAFARVLRPCFAACSLVRYRTTLAPVRCARTVGHSLSAKTTGRIDEDSLFVDA